MQTNQGPTKRELCFRNPIWPSKSMNKKKNDIFVTESLKYGIHFFMVLPGGAKKANLKQLKKKYKIFRKKYKQKYEKVVVLKIKKRSFSSRNLEDNFYKIFAAYAEDLICEGTVGINNFLLLTFQNLKVLVLKGTINFNLIHEAKLLKALRNMPKLQVLKVSGLFESKLDRSNIINRIDHHSWNFFQINIYENISLPFIPLKFSGLEGKRFILGSSLLALTQKLNRRMMITAIARDNKATNDSFDKENNLGIFPLYSLVERDLQHDESRDFGGHRLRQAEYGNKSTMFSLV